MAEQKFCVAFFRMDSKLSADATAGAKTKTQKQVRRVGVLQKGLQALS
jgi:hypothetical protein